MLGRARLPLAAAALALSAAALLLQARHAAAMGTLPLVLRALALNAAALPALAGVRLLVPRLRGRTAAALLAAAMVPAFLHHLVLLPARAGEGIEARLERGGMLSEGGGRGLVELGFAHPVYAPTLAARNREPFTRRVEVFLRLTGGDGRDALFRGARAGAPDGAPSVEAAVRGMLGPDGLLNPLTLAPGRTLRGRMAFVVADHDGGPLEALAAPGRARLEFRDADDGELLARIPVGRP